MTFRSARTHRGSRMDATGPTGREKTMSLRHPAERRSSAVQRRRASHLCARPRSQRDRAASKRVARVSSAYDLSEPEGSGQMVDEGTNDRRQAAACREDEMNDALPRMPLREDVDQAALRQLASAGMVRQECHPEPSNRRVTKGEEINASHARFMADRALRAIRSGERPGDLAHLICGGQRWQPGERRHIAAGA